MTNSVMRLRMREVVGCEESDEHCKDRIGQERLHGRPEHHYGAPFAAVDVC